MVCAFFIYILPSNDDAIFIFPQTVIGSTYSRKYGTVSVEVFIVRESLLDSPLLCILFIEGADVVLNSQALQPR
jgi:hypothetical protein